MRFPVIVALDSVNDFATLADVRDIAKKLMGQVWGFKVHALIDTFGPAVYPMFKELGHKIFVDVKIHDIGNTVHERTNALFGHGVDLISIHAEVGEAALKDAVAIAGHRIVAITQLTSHPDSAKVVERATVAHRAGVTNIVCSAHEVAEVKRNAPGITVITPGIRGTNDPRHDQSRVATPQEALAAGADLLVIGRSITESPDPLAALQKLMHQS